MSKKRNRKVQDLVGKKFGRLKVVGFEKLTNHQSFWTCECRCGCVVSVRRDALIQKKTRSCGCLHSEISREFCKIRKGKQSFSWKGGKTKDRGYVKLLNPKRFDVGEKPYLWAHRVIMEKILGRKLMVCESVHHKNAIKHDNRRENLELVTKNIHYGHIVCPYCGMEFLIR